MRIREPKTTALIFASAKMVSLTSLSVVLCMFFLSSYIMSLTLYHKTMRLLVAIYVLVVIAVEFSVNTS